MTTRIYQPGDRVEWATLVGKRICYGTIESIGAGKSDGLAMVLRDGADKSELRQLKNLSRSTKTRTAWPMRGEDRA